MATIPARRLPDSAAKSGSDFDFRPQSAGADAGGGSRRPPPVSRATADPEVAHRRPIFARYSAHLGFGSAAALVVIGWLTRDASGLSANAGLGYVLGFAALACMLALLIYPLRKRVRALAFLGPTKNWFRTHMILGTSGPLLALYHCNFQLGAINSRVALFSALAVAGSGFVGRYIYSKVHQGLYGRRTSLKDLLDRVKAAQPLADRIAPFVPELTNRLAEFDRTVMTPPASLLASVVLPFRLALITRLKYWELMRLTRRKLLAHAMCSPQFRRNAKSFEKITRHYVATHLHEVRRVAEFIAYQRLLALWHVIHRPFFVILLITVAIHLYAVYRY